MRHTEYNSVLRVCSRVLARPAPRLSRALFLNEIGAIMKIMRFARSRARAAYALAAVFFGAVALAALGSFVPDQALGALRSLIPGETPFLQLLLLGWIGVGLGRLTIKPAPSPAESSKPAVKPRRGTVDKDKDKDEKVDRVLRQVAKVLQSHMTDSESFSERLDGHNQRLSRHESGGPDQGDRAGPHRGQSRHARPARQCQEPA